jgi:hypothetical protein
MTYKVPDHAGIRRRRRPRLHYRTVPADWQHSRRYVPAIAHCVIADVLIPNANVFYELGIRHALQTHPFAAGQEHQGS